MVKSGDFEKMTKNSVFHDFHCFEENVQNPYPNLEAFSKSVISATLHYVQFSVISGLFCPKPLLNLGEEIHFALS